MLKIAVDARPLNQTPTGIGRYTEEILSHLQNEMHIALYSNNQIVTRLQSAEIHNPKITFWSKFLRNAILWQQFFLPQQLKKARVSLFWSPRHHLPLFGCKNIPMVLTIHDLVYRKHPETMKFSGYLLERLLLPASAKRAAHIITDSEASKKDLINELNIPTEKISVIHLGYHIPAKLKNDFDLSAIGIDKPYVLFLGSIEPRKNAERLVEAYLNLPKSLQNSHQLILAGGKGWKSEALLKKIKHLHNVRHLGYLKDNEVFALLQNATCFAFPSIYEGFGLPILEAMSMGTPVLTSQDPACVEVSGNAALLVDPFSTQSISEGLQEILENKSLREDLRSKGFENIKRFSWDEAATKHLAVFEQVISQAPRPTDQKH